MILLLVLLMAAADPAPAQAAVGEVQSVKPDFSNVTSQAQADELVKQGKLVRTYLFPEEFGGADIPENRTFVTPEALVARQLILGTMTRQIEQGLLDKMTVEPEYRGASFVPTRIVFRASSSKTGGTFEPVIEIW